MKKSLCGLFLVCAVLLATTLTAFAQSDTLIQGKWNLTGTLPKNKSGNTFTWFLEWTFSDGNFLLTGYPPLSQKGKYRVVKEEDNKLTLELYEQSGNFGTKDKQIEVIFDKENKTLKIDGKEGFKRVEKSNMKTLIKNRRIVTAVDDYKTDILIEKKNYLLCIQT